MARKKKTEVIKTQESAITYSGQVTVKKIKGGKVVSTTTTHNEGTKNLFKFILNCLAEKWIPSARPSWVSTGKFSSDSPNVVKYVSNTCSKLTQPPEVLESGDDVYVEYKFLLPSKPQYATTGFNCLLLYSDDKKPAVVADGQNVDTGYSMIVRFDTIHQASDEETLIIWQLKVLNPTV